MSTFIKFSLYVKDKKIFIVNVDRERETLMRIRSSGRPPAGGILWNNHRRGWRVVFISGVSCHTRLIVVCVCLPCAVFCSVFLFGQFGMSWVWKHCIVKDMCSSHKSWAKLSRTNDWWLQFVQTHCGLSALCGQNQCAPLLIILFRYFGHTFC